MNGNPDGRFRASNNPVLLHLAFTILSVAACRGLYRLPANRRSSPNASTEQQVPVDGAPRGYRLYVPASLSPVHQPALVLNFHGLGATAAQQERLSGMSALA